MPEVEVAVGDEPIILTQPHGGTWLPGALKRRLTPQALELADTDWHITRLYDGLLPGASVVRNPVHRYVIDVNRPPDGSPLYPGSQTTGLCPLTDFDGRPLYRRGEEPGRAEIERRMEAWHRPYHEAIGTRIEALGQRYPAVLVYDCHSIRSRIPRLFDGRLPVFNIGTFNDASCAAAIRDIAARVCTAAGNYDSVVDGRFKGGWTTRHYGRPDRGVHALQMELAQRAYMLEKPPWTYDEARAGGVREVLAKVLCELRNLLRDGEHEH